MAVAPTPKTWARPPAPPQRTAPAKPRRAPHAIHVPFRAVITAAILTGLLVAYVAGHALMTGANFKKVNLMRQSAQLERRNQELIRLRNQLTSKEAVEKWAQENHMALPQGKPVFVGLSVKGE